MLVETHVGAPWSRAGASRKHTYVAYRQTPHRAELLFAVPVDIDIESSLSRGTRMFRCPPCNLAIAVPPGWWPICTPRQEARSHDQVQMLFVGDDVSLEVGVNISRHALDAATILDSFLDEYVAQTPDSRRLGVPLAWTPPQFEGRAMPANTTAARAELDLLDDQTAVIHLIAHGRVLVQLALVGARRAIAEHADAISAAIGGVTLIDPDLDASLTCEHALAHHSGGKLEQNRFTSTKFGVSFAGPAGWTSNLQAPATSLFQVDYCSPDGSCHAEVYGVIPPCGLAEWCPATANTWFNQQRGVPDAGLTEWRTIEQAPGPGLPYRVVRKREDGRSFGWGMALMQDLAVVVRWESRTSEADDLAAQILSTLSR
jgi:hypothetical protein